MILLEKESKKLLLENQRLLKKLESIRNGDEKEMERIARSRPPDEDCIICCDGPKEVCFKGCFHAIFCNVCADKYYVKFQAEGKKAPCPVCKAVSDMEMIRSPLFAGGKIRY